MRTLILILTIFSTLPASGSAATTSEVEPRIEFRGVVCDPDCHLLFLVNGAETAWIAQGDPVAPGYKVVEYFGSEHGGAILVHFGRLIYIPLSKFADKTPLISKPPSAKNILSGVLSLHTGQGEPTLFTVKLEIGNTSRFPLGDGYFFVITPTRTPEGYVKYASAIEGGSGAAISTTTNPELIAVEGEGFSLIANGVGVDFDRGATEKK